MRIRPYFNELDYKYLAEWVSEERVHALWCAGLTEYPVTKEGMGALLEKDAEEWGGHGYMALEDEGTPVGFFCYSVNYQENFGFLKLVVVNPALRGKGLGRRMITLALKYAFDITGVSSVKLCVFDVNAAARRCYEKAGFTLNAVTEGAFRYGEECWGRCSMTAVRKGKPAYLYHGSQYLFDTVRPHQAAGECERESRMAIYAAETIKEVIPFALPIRWYPDCPEGKRSFTCSDGKTELLYGSLDPEGTGYIYKVPSEGFEKIDNWQWVSRREAVPEEIIAIKVRDYLDTVTFSEDAERIRVMLYGE